MSWLDDFLSFVVSLGGARVARVGGPMGQNLNFSDAFSVAQNATSGNVDVDIIPGGATRYYGCLYVSGGVASQTLTTAGTYYKVTQFDTAGIASGTTVSTVNDTITVNHTGYYDITASVSFHGDNSVTYTFGIYVNGALDPSSMAHVKLNSNGDGKETTMHGLFSLTANDVIDIRATADANNKALYVQYGNICVRTF